MKNELYCPKFFSGQRFFQDLTFPSVCLFRCSFNYFIQVFFTYLVLAIELFFLVLGIKRIKDVCFSEQNTLNTATSSGYRWNFSFLKWKENSTNSVCFVLSSYVLYLLLNFSIAIKIRLLAWCCTSTTTTTTTVDRLTPQPREGKALILDDCSPLFSVSCLYRAVRRNVIN